MCHGTVLPLINYANSCAYFDVINHTPMVAPKDIEAVLLAELLSPLAPSPVLQITSPTP
jgi:hypothetical protein